MDKESQLIWEAYLSEASNLEAYEDDALSGTWAAIIDGKEYSGIVRDLINNTQHIDQVDYPVAQLDKFGLFKFTKDGLTIPQNEDASANIDGKWIKYTDLTPQQKLDFSNDEVERLNQADMKYPILVAVNDRSEPVSVLDGNHRLAKALRDKHRTIKTRLVTKELLKEF